MKTIVDQTNQVITISEQDCSGQSLTLKSLSNCVIKIEGVIGALYIYNCTNCVIRAIFAKSACNMFKCVNCTIDIVCQKMRLNKSNNLVLKLLTKSNPALVESTNCVFSRQSLGPDHKRQMEAQTIDAFNSCDAWKNVQDFNSLNGAVTNFVIQ